MVLSYGLRLEERGAAAGAGERGMVAVRGNFTRLLAWRPEPAGARLPVARDRSTAQGGTQRRGESAWRRDESCRDGEVLIWQGTVRSWCDGNAAARKEAPSCRPACGRADHGHRIGETKGRGFLAAVCHAGGGGQGIFFQMTTGKSLGGGILRNYPTTARVKSESEKRTIT